MDFIYCTCGVYTGGARDPHPGCPVHAKEDEGYWMRHSLHLLADHPECPMQFRDMLRFLAHKTEQ